MNLGKVLKKYGIDVRTDSIHFERPIHAPNLDGGETPVDPRMQEVDGVLVPRSSTPSDDFVSREEFETLQENIRDLPALPSVMLSESGKALLSELDVIPPAPTGKDARAAENAERINAIIERLSYIESALLQDDEEPDHLDTSDADDEKSDDEEQAADQGKQPSADDDQ